eukprot:gene8971-12102_t
MSSPTKSISSKKQNNNKLSLFSILIKQYLEFLKGFIPFLHHLSHDFSQLFLGTLLLVGCIVAFVIFFLKNFNDARNSYFLEISSFDSNNNAIPQPNCKLIPLSITGTYLASKLGSWEGQSSFKYAEAIYNFKVINYERTLDGSVLNVLNRDFTFGSILNANGTCMQPVDTSFNPTSGFISMSWNYDNFVNDKTCNKIADPNQLNYDTISKSETFTAKFDVRALVTAASVNLRINSLDTLIEIPEYRVNLTGESATFMLDSYVEAAAHNSFISRYYDPKYPGMEPLSCVTLYSSNNLAICLVLLGKVNAFPIFNHIGDNETYPSFCDCANLHNDDIYTNSHHPCNLFRFISGFIFWPPSEELNVISDDYYQTGKFSGEATFSFAYYYWMKYGENGLYQANKDAYAASFLGSVYHKTNTNGGVWNSSEYRKEAFEFCNLGNVFGTCSMLVFTSYDVDQKTFTISNNYLQLKYGACQNTIALSEETWNNLVSRSFTQLTQKYQECVKTFLNSFVSGVGISQGFLAVFFPVIARIAVFLTDEIENDNNNLKIITDKQFTLSTKTIDVNASQSNDLFDNNNNNLKIVIDSDASASVKDNQDNKEDNYTNTIIEGNYNNDNDYSLIHQLSFNSLNSSNNNSKKVVPI